MHINPDSPFIHISVAICDTVIVTFLFALCCIPVFTIGASAAAMHKVMQDIALEKNSGVIAPFFLAFKENFKVATQIWMIALLVGAVVAADIMICFGFKVEQNVVLFIMRGLTIGCTLLYASFLSYVFAGIGHFYVTWKQAIRNAVVWTLKKPLYTLGLLVVNAAVLLSCYLVQMWAFPIAAGLLYLQALLLNGAFGFQKLSFKPKSPGEEEIYYE